ncbi:PP2C family protein-serine/threonine phosphatase [Actinacidiphila oryziradicis]|uniref:PP2C family protein-serine/threonine phosphatase n=1 Tax=Actinacidiphila oryziradicis TaxID=2571141 RepID=UPI0023F3049D|nr:PP2C family protein-serine/threonine phosphatase [Actinacidiphila oryziradicis]
MDRPPDHRRCLRPTGRHFAAGHLAAGHLAAGAPVLIVSAIASFALVSGTGVNWIPLLAVGPALAAATSSPWGVLRVGFLAVVLGLTVAGPGDELNREKMIMVCTQIAVTLASCLASALRGRRERVLRAVRSVAEAAQHALLKPVPATVGQFQVAVRYSAAAAEARIGGDLYALVPTPYGVRVIVGDVRGKGLSAVSTAALVLGIFREAAYDESDLLAVVGRIERSLARNLGCDDFVTAVVVGYPKADTMELVNCGHAPPLLLRRSGVMTVEPDEPAPPLGLRALCGEMPCLQVLPFADDEQLLLYTDGVTEARNHRREFYPLTERVARHRCDDPSRTLAALHHDLLAHVGGRLHDDAALLLLRKPAVAGQKHADVPLSEQLEPREDLFRPHGLAAGGLAGAPALGELGGQQQNPSALVESVGAARSVVAVPVPYVRSPAPLAPLR